MNYESLARDIAVAVSAYMRGVTMSGPYDPRKHGRIRKVYYEIAEVLAIDAMNHQEGGGRGEDKEQV